MSDAELKPLLLKLLDKVEGLVQDVAELKAGQEELRAGQARHSASIEQNTAQIEELKAGQRELKAGQAETNARLGRVESGLNELKGASSANYFRALGRIDSVEDRVEKLIHKMG